MSEKISRITGDRWTYGLVNMLLKENAVWWGTGKWIVQSLLWTAVITGSVSFIIYVFTTLPTAAKPEIVDNYGLAAAALKIFFNISGFTSVIGVIILTHDLIIGEIESGTAEWVLSKPVSRKAFVISKFIANAAWITLIIIILQGVLITGVIWFFNGELDLVPFIKGLSLIWLLCMFYASMLLFLGTVTASRGVALGIALLFFLAGIIAPLLLPELYYIMPWKLPDIAFSLAMSIAWSSKIIFCVILTSIWTVLFIAGALWRIEKIEI